MTKSNNELDTVKASELMEPILHEDCTFGYYDEYGDRIGALAIARYYKDFTTLKHNGGKAVRDDLLLLKPSKLYFGGEDVEVEWIAPAEDGSPRFHVPHGYDYYYGGDDD